MTTPGGTSTLANGYTYVAAPTLDLGQPDGRPGRRRHHRDAHRHRADRDRLPVTFDGVPATGVLVVNDSTVTATTPPHVGRCRGCRGDDARWLGHARQRLHLRGRADPDRRHTGHRSRTGATPVTLTGTGLTGTTAVTFDGVPATGLVVVSDTEVTVDTPAHAAGLVDVELTTPAGTATLTGGFTYLP